MYADAAKGRARVAGVVVEVIAEAAFALSIDTHIMHIVQPLIVVAADNGPYTLPRTLSHLPRHFFLLLVLRAPNSARWCAR